MIVTPKSWAPLDLACEDNSFDTLPSPIGHIVPEILVIIMKNMCSPNFGDFGEISNNILNTNSYH